MSRADQLIDARTLSEELAAAQPPLIQRPFILDVRWRLGEPAGAGRERFSQRHLPGSVFADLETVFSAHSDNPRHGRHPLPTPASLAQDLAALGVSRDRPIVIVDEAGSFAAERAWWVLGWVGLASRIMDGGIEAWTAAGYPLESGPVTPSPARALELTPGQFPTVTADQAAAAGLASDTVLIDARAAERFRGETEPIDPRPGHIPGAINVPVLDLFGNGGALPSDDEIRSRFGDLGDRQVVAYCGSGVSAAREVFALRTIGIEAALYPGSWSAWSNDPDRPVVTGPA